MPVWSRSRPSNDFNGLCSFRPIVANHLAAELRPSTASVVARTGALPWTDAAHMHDRAAGDPRRRPMAIYEAHLGSWRRGENGAFLSYDQIADATRMNPSLDWAAGEMISTTVPGPWAMKVARWDGLRSSG